MRELISMYVPEYTITPNILKSISSIEYNRSIIENSSILPNFETRLIKEAQNDFIVDSYEFIGEVINYKTAKLYVDGLARTQNPKIQNALEALKLANELARTQEIEEENLKQLHKTLTNGVIPGRHMARYRNNRIARKTDPEEILAEISELFDWFNSLEAMETNPVIVAGIVKGQLEITYPFEFFNSFISDLCARVLLYSRGYSFTKFTTIETYYNNSKRVYEQNLMSIIEEEGDFTTWLEYYAAGMDAQTATATEKVKLYVKDTKLAKVSGRVKLTKRQEKIVEYLQDYGILQNKQFSRLFPNLSEDSVLRDIKTLMDADIVVKRGKTKSSRYELA